MNRYLFLALAVFAAASSPVRADRVEESFKQADKSAEIAGFTISKVQRWLHEVALKRIEPDTGLDRTGHGPVSPARPLQLPGRLGGLLPFLPVGGLAHRSRGAKRSCQEGAPRGNQALRKGVFQEAGEHVRRQ